jgi:hypothetical protein
MDFFLHITLPVTAINFLFLILCLWLSIKFSLKLKSLRYASIISFVVVFIALTIPSNSLLIENEFVGLFIALFFVPGFFLALPIMLVLNAPIDLGPCVENTPFQYAFVGSFIFYTLLIFGILKFWQKFKEYKTLKNRSWRFWFE